MYLYATNLMARGIAAADGHLGHIHDLYFDDQRFSVRWLVADVGHWLPGRRVLISPSQVGMVDLFAAVIPVKLTKDQVRHSPPGDTALPVSAQRQSEVARYYGLLSYEDPLGIWAPVLFPAGKPEAAAADQHHDPHLRSAREILTYAAHCRDGVLGSVSEILVNPRKWTLEAFVARLGEGALARHVMIAPGKVALISYEQRYVRFDLARADVPKEPPPEIIG
jgi:hypothetical protein